MNYAVLIPYYGRRDEDHVACVRSLKNAGVLVAEVDGCPYIDMARAGLVSIIEEATTAAQVDVFVFIDHDIMFQKDAIDKLAEHCRSSEYGMLGVLYAWRKAEGGLIGKLKNPPESLIFYEPGFWPADFLGLGCTAIKREVFDTLKATCPRTHCSVVKRDVHPFFMHMVHPRDGYIGEDVSFCRRVEAAGYKLGVDLEPRIFHRGQYDYAIEDAGASVTRYQTLEVKFKTT